LKQELEDVDCAQKLIIVRDGKGMKDRVTALPDSLIGALQDHLCSVKRSHQQDLDQS
jgi:site-specific recombinase XerD